jgi:hypothetical protein
MSLWMEHWPSSNEQWGAAQQDKLRQRTAHRFVAE